VIALQDFLVKGLPSEKMILGINSAWPVQATGDEVTVLAAGQS
jgi:hypothetical protein